MGDPLNDITVDINEWVIAKTTSSGYLGRVSGRGLALSKLASQKDVAFESFKKGLLEHAEADKFAALMPCFDFMAPLRPVQRPDGGMAFQRDPVVVPFDFTTQATPVYVKIVSLMFCGDLTGADAALYLNFINQSIDMAIRARAQSAGLSLVGPGGMPPRGPGRG